MIAPSSYAVPSMAIPVALPKKNWGAMSRVTDPAMRDGARRIMTVLEEIKGKAGSFSYFTSVSPSGIAFITNQEIAKDEGGNKVYSFVDMDVNKAFIAFGCGGSICSGDAKNPADVEKLFALFFRPNVKMRQETDSLIPSV
jgi:hypothetical protein